MCGIIGGTHTSEKAIRDSLATFAYRGPDARQYFSDEEISLGHARLSIIDLDARANQPFFDAAKEVGIVFNGEIYNYQELRDELQKAHGMQFRTTSDTEVLLEGYKVWDCAGLLPRLRGMFAFAIYDLRTKVVVLARDHAGIKPLYYSVENSHLLFASELKGVVSLLRESNFSVEIDLDALNLYPVLGYIPSPHTMVKGVKKLERGTWLQYDLDTQKSTIHEWQPVTKKISTVDEMRDAIRSSVVEHCIADVPVGTFFSGGIDSSLIAAVLKEAGMNLETYSIHVAGRDADKPYFTAIAKELGVKAQVAEFGPKEFEATYEDIMSRIDDPIADTSIFPTTFVARLAAQKVKVVLSGEGGDELFLGYPRTLAIAHMKKGKTSKAFDTAFLSSPSFSGKNKLFSDIAKLNGLAADYYLLSTSQARDLSSKSAWEKAEAWLAKGEPRFIDRDWYLENMLLRKTDMASSYASIEGRVPLLGAELWNSAPNYADVNLSGGGKSILKDMLATFIPRELIDRPKAGFGLGLATLQDSPQLSADLHSALPALRDIGLSVDPSKENLIKDRYPVYAFGLVVLHHALKNLNLM